MSYDLGKAVGYEEPDVPVAWNQRDLILYAIGIGAKKDDFALINELDKSWSPFPTYPVVLIFKRADQDLNDFKARIGGGTRAPGLPKFDPNRGVHATQSIQVIKPIPAVSGDGWKLKRKIVAISENKSGIVLESECILVDPQGEVYAKLYTSSFNLGAKALNKPFTKRIAGPPQPSTKIPRDRKPDYVVTDKTTPEQAITYRLSGDYNELHINPKIGQSAGFGGVILHGLSTYGFAARSIVSSLTPSTPSNLKFFSVRFTSPVKPGDSLETSIWVVGQVPKDQVDGEEDVLEVLFETKNVKTGKVCLGNGLAWVKKDGSASTDVKGKL
ncbi:hypothetical protein ABKN59_009193 [Abortiporus biennis]